MPDLLTNFRDHLVSVNLARKPSVAGVQHPLWLEPVNGVPAPRERQATEDDTVLVMGAMRAPGLASAPYESFLRVDAIDLYFRAAPNHASDTYALEELIRAAVIDRRDWTMGTMRILESVEWRALSPLANDEQGHLHSVQYMFWTNGHGV